MSSCKLSVATVMAALAALLMASGNALACSDSAKMKSTQDSKGSSSKVTTASSTR